MNLIGALLVIDHMHSSSISAIKQLILVKEKQIWRYYRKQTDLEMRAGSSWLSSDWKTSSSLQKYPLRSNSFWESEPMPKLSECCAQMNNFLSNVFWEFLYETRITLNILHSFLCFFVILSFLSLQHVVGESVLGMTANLFLSRAVKVGWSLTGNSWEYPKPHNGTMSDHDVDHKFMNEWISLHVM